jgi:hypothetical protein
VCLLAAFGDTFFIPVREALYHLPGLGIFRFPAIFRLFAIVGVILTASFIMKLYEEKGERSGEWKWLLGSLGFVALVIVALSIKNTVWGSVVSDFKAFHFIWADMPGQSAAALLGGGLQLAFLALFFFFRKNLKALAFIAIANSIVFVQLNIGTTVINKESPQVIENFLAKMPQGPTIDNNRLMGNTHFDAPAPLWRNLGIFYCESSYDGNNPFRLRNFAEFEASDSAKEYTNKLSFYIENDTIEFGDNKHFNRLQLSVTIDSTGILIVNQNMGLNWDIKYDLMESLSGGMPSIKALLGNTSTESKIKGEVVTRIQLSPGKSVINFKYDPPYVFEFFIISMVILLLTLGALNTKD